MSSFEIRTYAAFVNAPLDVIRQPNFEKLDFEIDTNATITTARDAPTSPNDMTVPDVRISFATALSGPEITELDVIIAAHDGLDLVRGTDTHTFLFSGKPDVNDDSLVVGVGGLDKYQVGDFGFDTLSGPPFDLYVVDDLTAGAAQWTKQNLDIGTSPSLLLIATMDAIQVSTTPGAIQYDSDDLTRIGGFFAYLSPTLTCLKACRIAIWPRLDSTVNTESSRSGIRLDIRLNDVSRQVFDNNADSGGGLAKDTQNNASDLFDVAVDDTIKIFINSYITGLSDVWGGPNRLLLIVMEDLT